MKRLFAPLAVSALLAAPAFAEEVEQFDAAVAAMKDGIVIEAPWAVSLRDDEILVFMTIHNSEEDDVITGVTSKVADKAQLSKFAKVLRDAEAVETFDVPGGEVFNLDQGGYHLELSDLNEDLESGAIVPVTLTFENAGEVEVLVSLASVGE